VSEPALPGPATDRSTAVALDASDPIRGFRDEFVINDPALCYLDGNSLGRLPKATIVATREFLEQEWASELVDGWSHWIDEAQPTGDLVARAALGAGPGQTLVCDTTSVNFYQLCVAAIRANPGRRKIVIDSANFPTDRYILEGIAELLDLELVTLDTDGSGGPNAVRVQTENELIPLAALDNLLDENTALLTLQAINYRSGARQDLRGISELARRKGVFVVWDCSHAIGSIQLNFDANGVDLAVGCTYKYGNSGPGSPAWLFVRSNLQAKFQVPIRGWFSQADQFAMGPFFERAEGIRGFQIASPSIIGLRAVRSSFEMIERAGISEIEKKAAVGTELMLQLADSWLTPLGFATGTPRSWQQRGGHIILTHPDAKQIAAALRSEAKVIPDYREPNSIRLAISPLANSYEEIWEGFHRLRELVASGNYRNFRSTQGRVT
jgi:kynureninase